MKPKRKVINKRESVGTMESMRLDKFLKVSRLIKRRTLAKEVAEQGRISINGQTAKASSNVKVGDELTIQFGQKQITVRVEQLLESTKKEDASSMYTLVKEERLEEPMTE
jgi:ribosomal 50S subunit-recycling heat shock protein